MGDVRVRKVDHDVIVALKRQAKQHGLTLEGEVRALLSEAALRPKRQLVDELQQSRDGLRAKYGEFPDSAPFIRAERDRRG